MFSLRLSQQQTQAVLNALALRPYSEVAELIQVILNQTQAQQRAMDAEIGAEANVEANDAPVPKNKVAK